MKGFASAAAVFCFSGAFASYELALILDNDGKVHRYDAENGVYLGRLNPTIQAFDITANKATGEASLIGVNNAGAMTIEKINFHTGRRVGSFVLTGFNFNSFGQNSLSLDSNGNYLIAGTDNGGQFGGGHGVFRFSPSGTFIGPVIRWNATDFQYAFSHQMSNGAIYTMSNTNSGTWTNRIMGFNPVNNSYVGNYIVSSDFFEGSGYISGGTGSGDRMVFGEYLSVSDEYRMHSVVRSGNGLVASTTRTFPVFGSTYLSLTEGAIANYEFGHSNYGYVFGGRVVGTETRVVITPMNLETMTFNTNFQYVVSEARGLRATAMVVAPEPGTMTALALGAAAFLRRRKK